MYLDFFGLHERPFSITPDPRYLFMSERHAEALAHLIYGVTESDGFIVLTGEVGTGKTTLVRSLLQKMPAEADVALVLNPQLTATEFLTAICHELGIEVPDDTDSSLALTSALNQYLLQAHARGRRTIAIVDEAQNLSAEVLEQIRLLTNLETTRNKLLQIVLIGQPELRDLLARSDLRQLAQRVTARYHLMPLSAAEASEYLDHRLAVAGALRPILGKSAKKRIHQLASGIPRLMNLIADRSLLGAWSREQKEIDARLVDAAATEVFGKAAVREAKGGWHWSGIAASVAAAALLTTTLILLLRAPGAASEPVPQPVAIQPVAEPVSAPATEPVAASVPTPALDDWLGERRNLTGNDEAFATLFTLWGETFDAGVGNACEQARAVQLRCVASSSSLAGLLLLDRPAILTLRDLDGEPHQVVLRSAAEASLQLEIAGDTIDVGIGEMAAYWFGDYLLLWRPPNDDDVNLVPGARGSAVVWLRQSLTAILGEPIEPRDSDRYDDNLQARVRDYQRARRLDVDGVVGQRTQMMINTDLGLAGIPRLQDAARAMTLARDSR